LSASYAERSSNENNCETAAATRDLQAEGIDEVACATRDKLSKANHALLELSKVRPVKEEETGDDNVPIPALRCAFLQESKVQ